MLGMFSIYVSSCHLNLIHFSTLRAMLHDPVAYPNPEDFSPERFIGPHGEFVEDPDLTVAFGWGRRFVHLHC